MALQRGAGRQRAPTTVLETVWATQSFNTSQRWHYAVADECNSLVLLGEGMDESFVTTVTTVTIRQYSDAFWYIIGKRKLTSCRLRGLV